MSEFARYCYSFKE